jgi:hypothetical protein
VIERKPTKATPKRKATPKGPPLLPVVPWTSPAWPADLRDRLSDLRGRYTMVRTALPDGTTQDRIARVERVLRALEIGQTDDALLARLDKIARPYIRKDPRWDPDVERERPYVASLLRDWWAASLMSFVSLLHTAKTQEWSPKELRLKLAASAAQTVATFAEIIAAAEFTAVREVLPARWRSPTRLTRMAARVADLVDRDLVDEKRPDFDNLGEKIARRALKAIGYPDAKVKSLFDLAGKRVKPVH